MRDEVPSGHSPHKIHREANITTYRMVIAASLVAIVAGSIGTVLGYRCSENTNYQVEIRLHWAVLAINGSKLEPSFREFMKARYYSLIRRAPKASLAPEFLEDFGPVDEGLLRGLPIGKGPLIASDEYLEAKNRIPSQGGVHGVRHQNKE